MHWLEMKSELQPYYPFSRCPRIQEEFRQYLESTPNKKHISKEEKLKLVAWLVDPNAKPTCQKDYSRRNYAQKTYRWDESRQELWAMAKKDKGGDRIVITVDEILDVVERVHTANHGGWDATWDRVSRKYCGIVRSDIIFLVKRCGLCQSDPRKRAKGGQAQSPASTTAYASTPSPPMTPPEPQIEYDESSYDDNEDGENEGNDVIQYWQEQVWHQEWMDMQIDPSLLPYYDYSVGESSSSGSSNTYTYDFGQ
ncbi:hypothetical protein BBK36DRAFT_1183018 [Trichoderma citrinoviride]|uniref:Integrase zinc-binding domain-containing protein n=1 Tax=Trichoderma citrinoviride TaxID=58853 RepID=A0A2T4B1F3_9HYPO|nr:hypothetical protein BBK36DRAFT_1183018 [Trichoderma citrinoviride]PTB63149.1 hypothetical protein BBK36DRAFT_1183018 [Trichoderma citrinoviride]